MALPGVTTVLKDRFFTLTRTDAPFGPRVLAMATRDTADGTADAQGNHVANYDPYSPRTEADVIAAFGNGSGCHRAYLELIAGGATRVVVLAIPSGTTDVQLASDAILDPAFEAAEVARPDIIVPWGRGGHPTDWESPATPNAKEIGFHADNTTAGSLTGNLAQKVANKCQLLTDRTHPCFAVMGIKPWLGTEGATPAATGIENITSTSMGTHVALANLTDHGATAFGMNGQYLTVIGAELNVSGYPQNATDRTKSGDFGYSNGACLLAGHLSQLDPWRAITGKQIFNVTGMRYNPTRVQQQSMIDKGIVPITLDFNRVPIWVDGLTFGKSTSDYTRLSTLRIAFTAIQGVRQVAQQFIGEAATLHNRNALDTAVTSMLRGMTQLGAITDSDFVITYIPRENKAIIDLVMRPVFELRNIEISIAVDL
jgi:hypothetical protein